ncbi:CerR family C-terminal domain-containing protein [Rugamonas sp. CCM 8940]|uniref:CerR family C-terminal domain-containing protein n=1 Tax=Rugamonas sp. CCM 8940 TaxID=2765359 RepID=UPI0018F54538|nr:CerR family C-terminal domain-containing protein [Rugamonas sp. CCM 8940]MBJ7313552.1 CerR family C-terminal domain-containing protein [Rugamonas sp. CCM 8940]
MIDKIPPDSPKPADDARKPRIDGEQSRERLRMAAMRLFAEQGYANTSTREIALAAGANVAAISYYFGDKAGLYSATFAEVCTDPRDSIAMFDQPHFTLTESLQGFYRQMLAPLLLGEEGELMLRLWYREMLEPTGLWLAEIDNSIKPEHMALVGVLCRHLGRAAPNDDTHRLAHAIAALAIHLMVGRDIIERITPRLLADADAIEQWSHRLVRYASAMVEAERDLPGASPHSAKPSKD